MGFKVTITPVGMEARGFDVETCAFEKETIDTTASGSAGSDVLYSLVLKGKISKNAEGEEPVKTALSDWSIVPSSSQGVYADVKVDAIAADYALRSYTFTTGFLFSYKEEVSSATGEGTFVAIIKQKKDKNAEIIIEGGYESAAM